MKTKTNGNIIQFLNGSHSLKGIWFGEEHPKTGAPFWWRNDLDEYKNEHEKLIEVVKVANQMLNCLMTEQEIRLWQDWRSWGKIASWREQALAQIELFQKLNKELTLTLLENKSL